MVFVFGACELDVDRRELRRAGVVRPLEPKAFTVLVHLLMQRHRVVSKDELLTTGWPGEFVTEAALTRCLKVIRQAVGDDGVRQHLIKTLRGHGYRFVATVTMGPPPLAEVPPLHDQAGPSAPALMDASASVPVPARRPTVAPPALNTGIPCPQCHTSNRAARQFCAACGQALWRLCLHYGFGNSPTEHFCGGCGGVVAVPVPVTTSARTGLPRAYTPAPLATQILASQQHVVGERKYATVSSYPKI